MIDEIEWHPTASVGMLHAVPKANKANRNSLCYQLCILPPYPPYVLEKQKGKKPLRCSICTRKIMRMQEV